MVRKFFALAALSALASSAIAGDSTEVSVNNLTQANNFSSSGGAGKWVSAGKGSILKNANYTMILAPNALGRKCNKGDLGYVMKYIRKQTCTQENSGGSHCSSWKVWYEIDLENGTFAKCV